MPQMLVLTRQGRQPACDHRDQNLASGSKGIRKSSMLPLLFPKQLQAEGSCLLQRLPTGRNNGSYFAPLS